MRDDGQCKVQSSLGEFFPKKTTLRQHRSNSLNRVLKQMLIKVQTTDRSLVDPTQTQLRSIQILEWINTFRFVYIYVTKILGTDGSTLYRLERDCNMQASLRNWSLLAFLISGLEPNFGSWLLSWRSTVHVVASLTNDIILLIRSIEMMMDWYKINCYLPFTSLFFNQTK